jgi:hypothetical protein
MRVQLHRELPLKRTDKKTQLLALGVVRAVTFLNKISPRATLVGARKRSILDLFPVCLRIRVVRLVRGLARVAPILVMQLVMLVRVRLVLLWVRRKIVSVALTRPRSVARIPIMRMDGAVAKFVVNCCHAGNIPVRFPVMRDCVVAVRLALTPVAIVENCRRRCCVSQRMRRRTVESSAMTARKMSGPAALTVERLVTVHLTVASIHARRTATRKILSLHTVLGHQMSLSTALVAKRRYLRSQGTHLVPPAKTLF